MIEEYLLSYGALGDFGRFHSVAPIECRRGDRAVARTPRGIELGTVMCEVRPGHAQLLSHTLRGELLRLAAVEDVQVAERMRLRAHTIFDGARLRSEELQLPVEILDVEVPLDGEHAIVHHLHWNEWDPRPLVSSLSREYDIQILLTDLTAGPVQGEEEAADAHGCGRPDCGKGSHGACGDRGGCGTCSAASTCGLKQAVDMKAYFAQLRRQMEQH